MTRSRTMKRALILLLLLLTAIPVLAADDKPLSRRERKERIAKLSEQHRQFLLDVAPIIIDTERDTFLRLETNPQREAFIDDFWRRRDQARGLTNLASRVEYYNHLEYVRENFGQISSDRGRIFLIHGPPAEVVPIKCERYFQPSEVWRYDYLPGFGTDFRILFYMPRHGGDYRIWNPLDYNQAMRDLVATGIEASGRLPDNIVLDCPNGEHMATAMAQMQMDKLRLMKLYDPPAVNEEDVNRILRSVILADPDAPKLPAEMTVGYPWGDGSRTDAQITILVPRAALETTTAGQASVYTLDVVGEVLRDDKLWEKYRYRFDFPADTPGEKLPIVIDRQLRPATYKSRVKISDAATRAEAILEADLVVPEVDAMKPTPENETLKTIREDLQSSRATLRIAPMGEDVISGVQTIQTMSTGAISAVEFWLDGKKIATRRSPPYTLDLDFGTVPRSRRIRVVALDSHGEAITGDEIVVNTGTDPFRVRIASPRVAPKLKGPTRVEIDVRVPATQQLASLELYWNETRLATLYDAPFVHTVNIPSVDGVGYLRAVAALKNPDIDPVEDVVMVNTPDYMETIDVHLVELPTTVLREGKPVNDLPQSAFSVLDEGQPVTIAKFEYVRDLPLSLGMAVDTSGSMEPRMATARDAGAAFFQNVLRKGDKAFVVAFDAQPHMIQKWSSELVDIHSGLARLRPEESTALYDAVIYSLYNFLGVKGQKAFVLLTDGKDTSSKFTFDQALEYSQRAAVPIYTIGLGIRTVDMETRGRLNRFASETGGTSYYIDSVDDLSKIYADIENELRSQYVIGFYPPADVKAGGKWREVAVRTDAGEVKTIRGYYP